MSCERYEEWIALAAGGDLDGDDRRRLERHLESCTVCRELLEAMRSSRRVVAGLGGAEVPEAALAAVRGEVLRRVEEGEISRRRLLGFPLLSSPTAPSSWLAAAAVILLILGAGWWLSRSPGEIPAPRVAELEPAEPSLPDPTIPEPTAPVAEASTPKASTPNGTDVPVSPERHSTARTEIESAEPRTAEPRTAPPGDRVVRVAASSPGAPASPRTAPAAEPPRPAEPMLVKWHVEDPDLVIYWMVEADASEEESEHAISEV